MSINWQLAKVWFIISTSSSLNSSKDKDFPVMLQKGHAMSKAPYWYFRGWTLYKRYMVMNILLKTLVTSLRNITTFSHIDSSWKNIIKWNDDNLGNTQYMYYLEWSVIYQNIGMDDVVIKVILCASEHICSIVRYCFRSFKQL